MGSLIIQTNDSLSAIFNANHASTCNLSLPEVYRVFHFKVYSARSRDSIILLKKISSKIYAVSRGTFYDEHPFFLGVSENSR